MKKTQLMLFAILLLLTFGILTAVKLSNSALRQAEKALNQAYDNESDIDDLEWKLEW